MIDIVQLLIETIGGWAGLGAGLLTAAAIYNFNRDRRMLAAQRVSIPAWLAALPVNKGEATQPPASIRIAA